LWGDGNTYWTSSSHNLEGIEAIDLGKGYLISMPGQDDMCVLEALALTAYHDGMQKEDPAQIL